MSFSSSTLRRCARRLLQQPRQQPRRCVSSSPSSLMSFLSSSSSSSSSSCRLQQRSPSRSFSRSNHRDDGDHYVFRDPEIRRLQDRSMVDEEDELRALIGKAPRKISSSLSFEERVMEFTRKRKRVFPEAPLSRRLPGVSSAEEASSEERPLATSLKLARLQMVQDIMRTKQTRDEIAHALEYRDLNDLDLVVPESEGVDRRWKQRCINAIRREMLTVDNNWNTGQKEELLGEAMEVLLESEEDKEFRRFCERMAPPPQ